MTKRASVIGVGATKFGSVLETPELKNKTFQELVAEAAFEAMDDAGITPPEIDGFIVGNMLSHTSQIYSHATVLADWLGLRFKGGFHFDTACSTTNTGIGIAWQMVMSGKYKNVLVVAGEILSSAPKTYNPLDRQPIDASTLWGWTDFGVDHVYAYHHFYDVASAYGAFPTIGYMRKNGISFEDMDKAMCAVNKTVRTHSSLNPKALLYEKGTLEDEAKREGFSSVEEYWNSPKNPFFAWPTRLYSALNTADGATAIIVSSEPEKYSRKMPIDILGFDWAASNYPWYGEDTYLPQDKIAFEKAYQMAGITAKDLDYLYVHDCMQIYQLQLSEVAGYIPEGQAWKYALDGKLLYNGEKPLNVSGGRHGGGHAFEASAGLETYEIVKQMRGEAQGKQIKPYPEIAAQHNHGYGMHTAVTIFKAGK
ncbi:MAG: thiolase family protein [Candidatus Pacebacteria bacterium]|jgi:acetyl-CoA C-acetyltransferase|nr:thiolase family protein [Candidatus Paceibacterota bacterium]